jgi:hypothetical protein
LCVSSCASASWGGEFLMFESPFRPPYLHIPSDCPSPPLTIQSSLGLNITTRHRHLGIAFPQSHRLSTCYQRWFCPSIIGMVER